MFAALTERNNVVPMQLEANTETTTARTKIVLSLQDGLQVLKSHPFDAISGILFPDSAFCSVV